MREERIGETRTSASNGVGRGSWHSSQPRSPVTFFASRADRAPDDDEPAKVYRLQPEEDPRPPSMVDRLLERKVAQWFIAYLAVAWILLQLTEILAQIWNLPVAVQRGISITLGLGTFPAMVVAWYHGEMGRQRICWVEIGIMVFLVAGTVATVWRVCFL